MDKIQYISPRRLGSNEIISILGVQRNKDIYEEVNGGARFLTPFVSESESSNLQDEYEFTRFDTSIRCAELFLNYIDQRRRVLTSNSNQFDFFISGLDMCELVFHNGDSSRNPILPTLPIMFVYRFIECAKDFSVDTPFQQDMARFLFIFVNEYLESIEEEKSSTELSFFKSDVLSNVFSNLVWDFRGIKLPQIIKIELANKARRELLPLVDACNTSQIYGELQQYRKPKVINGKVLQPSRLVDFVQQYLLLMSES